MSKLDAAIADSYTAAPEYRKAALKNNVKTLLLELIQDDETRPEGNGSSAKVRRAVERNRLRAELRQKVEEL